MEDKIFSKNIHALKLLLKLVTLLILIEHIHTLCPSDKAPLEFEKIETCVPKINPIIDGYFFDPKLNIFKKCVPSCHKCNITPYNCLVCANSYFPKYGTITPCFSDNNPPLGFYLHHTSSTSDFRACSIYCIKCDGEPTTTNQNCRICQTNTYFKFADENKNCYSAAQLPNYFLYYSTFYPCHRNCATCTEQGNDYDNKCVTCPTGYVYISGTRNCNTGGLSKFYYDDLKKIYLPCYPNCANCGGEGTLENHNCLSCEKGYFPLEDNFRFCYIKTEKVPDYIFKENIFKKCEVSCMECSQPKFNPEIHNCIKCKSGFFKSFEIKTNCYKENKERFYLSLDYESQERMFLPCYESCLFCTGKGDSENNKCTKCDESNNFFIDDEKNSQKESFNCLSKNTPPYGFYLDSSNKFVKCENLNNGSNKNLEILSFVPNFLDIYTSADIKIKFNNYISDTIIDYKILDAYFEAFLSDGKAIRYGLGIRGFICNTLNVNFNPPLQISGFNNNETNIERFTNDNDIINYNKTNTNNNDRILQSEKTGNFNLYIVVGNGLLLNTDPKKLNVLISENKIPDALKEDSNDFNTIFQNYIFSNNITQNLILRTKKGNAIQIYKSTNESISFATELSRENSFSYLDLSNCLKIIISFYNEEYKKLNSTFTLKNEDILIFKVDYEPKIFHYNSNYNGYRTKIYLYNSKSVAKEKIDLSICEENIELKIPANSNYPENSPLDFNSATFFKNKFNVDLYNPKGRLYSDMCYKYFDNETDFTINDRRREIFPNITITCSENCEFVGLDVENKYAICTCMPSALEDVRLNYFNETLPEISVTNLNLFGCFLVLMDDNMSYENIGYYFGIVILLLFFSNLFIYLFLPKILRKIEKKEIDKINEIDNKDSIPEIKEIPIEENNEIIVQNSPNKANKNKEKFYYEISFSIFNDFIHLRIYNSEKPDLDQKIHYKTLMNLKKLILSDGCCFISIDQKVKRKMIEKFSEKKSNFLEEVVNSINDNKEFKYKLKKDLENKIPNENNKEFKYKIKKFAENKITNKKENNKEFRYKIKKNQKKTEIINVEEEEKENRNLIDKNEAEKKEEKKINNKTLVSNKVNILGVSDLNATNDNKIAFTENDKTGFNQLNKNKEKDNNNGSNDFYKGISAFDINDNNSQGNIHNYQENLKNNPFIIQLNTYQNAKIENRIESDPSLIFFNSNTNKYSLVDYDLFDFPDFLDFDKRNFKKRLADNLQTDNLSISILLRRSVIYPIHLRIATFLFLIIFDFSIISFFITPDIISNRHIMNKVKYKVNNFKDNSTILGQFFYMCFISALVTSIIGALCKFSIIPNKIIQKDFGKVIINKNYKEIEEQ